ncbi:MAG: putative endonuclease [Candidatus Midichloriaceae bacterium]|jgi:putative endonuclease
MGIRLKNYQKGVNAEILVMTYLKKKLYTIIKHRYKSKLGEIDLIAAKNDLLLFIEVKNRKNFLDYDVISKKQKIRCCETALYFISQHTDFSNYNMRFDCMFVDDYGMIKHLQNAWSISDFNISGWL